MGKSGVVRLLYVLSRRQRIELNSPISQTRQYLEVPAKRPAHVVSRSTWLEGVEAQSSRKEVIVAVHGFNTSRAGLIGSAQKINGLANPNGTRAVIGYDWPANYETSASWLNVLKLPDIYDHDRKMTAHMAKHFLDDMQWLAKATGCRVNLLAHSMGAFLVATAIHARRFAFPSNVFGQIILGAADIEQHDLKVGRFGKTLADKSKRVVHYHSKYDKVLHVGGQVIHGGKSRSGQVGPPLGADRGLIQVDMSWEYRRQRLTGLRRSHNWYWEDQLFLFDMLNNIIRPDQIRFPTRRRIGDHWRLENTNAS